PLFSTLSLHDALPIFLRARGVDRIAPVVARAVGDEALQLRVAGDARARERRVARRRVDLLELGAQRVDDLEVRAFAEAAEIVLLDRKSTRLNSSHDQI